MENTKFLVYFSEQNVEHTAPSPFKTHSNIKVLYQWSHHLLGYFKFYETTTNELNSNQGLNFVPVLKWTLKKVSGAHLQGSELSINHDCCKCKPKQKACNTSQSQIICAICGWY